VEEFTHTLLENLPYLGLFIILMLTGLGLPLPEDIPLLAAGALCGAGHANIYIMIPVAVASVVGSDCLVLYLGSKYGHHIPKLPILKHFLTEKKLARAEEMFAKHGGKTLILSRFMPGLRAALYFSAGLFKVPMWKLLVYDGGAALFSVPAWVLFAYFFAGNWESVVKIAHRLQLGIGIGVVLVVVSFIIWQVIRHKKKKQEILAKKEAKSQRSGGSENSRKPSIGVDSSSSVKAEPKSS
jgi:membrane protein DedA with SNARE-associated domain